MADSEQLLQSRIFEVRRHHHTTADGHQVTRDIVHHPGSVVLLPVLDDGSVCLLRNFRLAAGGELLELPAGTLEAGEEPADCAARELIEETGFRAGRIELLASFCVSPGILSERMHLFLATDLTPGDNAPEPGEELEPIVVAWDEAMEMLDRGEIQDAKTLVGLLFWYRRRIV